MEKDAKKEITCLAIEERIFDGEEQASVNARELWKALGSKQEFANWIKDRIADFKEGQDFTVDKFINGRNERGRFASKEYYITLDVAKHLAMLERNDAGRKIRQYFIEAEKEYRRKAETPRPEQIVAGMVKKLGWEEVANRLSMYEMAMEYFPKNALGTLTGDGKIRGTVRRGSNPVRGGRPATVITQHQLDLFDFAQEHGMLVLVDEDKTSTFYAPVARVVCGG